MKTCMHVVIVLLSLNLIAYASEKKSAKSDSKTKAGNAAKLPPNVNNFVVRKPKQAPPKKPPANQGHTNIPPELLKAYGGK